MQINREWERTVASNWSGFIGALSVSKSISFGHLLSLALRFSVSCRFSSSSSSIPPSPCPLATTLLSHDLFPYASPELLFLSRRLHKPLSLPLRSARRAKYTENSMVINQDLVLFSLRRDTRYTFKLVATIAAYYLHDNS